MKLFGSIIFIVYALWCWKATQVSFVQHLDGSTHVKSGGVWHYVNNATGQVRLEPLGFEPRP